MWYCTLNDAKSLMAAGKDSEATDNDHLMTLIHRASTRVNLELVGRSGDYIFLPQIKTRQVLLSANYIDSIRNTLMLKWPLLAITSVSVDGTSVTSVASGYPAGETPYRLLRINSSGSHWYSYISTNCGDPVYAEIAGVWGWHSNYAEAWQDSGLDLSANISSSVLSLTTSDVDRDDLYGLPPALSRGALIKIDDEFMWILDTTPTSDTASLKRGVLGSTAAAHESGASIYVWQTEEPIRHVVARQAAFMYHRRGAYEQSTFDGAVSVQYPADLLLELASVLTEYANA